MQGRSRQIILGVAVSLTLLMNTLAGTGLLFGRDPGSISDGLPNAFTPAGFTFGIWSLIFVGLIAFAAWQGRADQRGERLDRVAVPFLLGNVLNVTWLLAWHSLNYGLSVLVMLALLGSLAWLYVRLDHLELRGPERLWLGAPVSLYFGWISVATVANVTAWMVSLDLAGAFLGVDARTWAALLIGMASLVGAFLLWRKRDWVFASVLAWSFYGVHAARPTADVITVAVVAGVLLLLVAFVMGLRRLRTDPPRSLGT